MATSGAAAWLKYYSGKGDVPTVMRLDAPILDKDGHPKNEVIKAGTDVTVLKTGAYEAKPLISTKKYGTIRVPFDSIAKPGITASSAPSLKPQAFGLKDVHYPVTEYIKIVMDNIQDRKDIDGKTKAYLEALFTYYSQAPNSKNLARVKATFDKSIRIADVEKDFGEVLGPIAIIKHGLLAPYKVKLSSSAKIYVPSRPNEPLLDYSVIDGNRTYVISAKSGTTTNVVKPDDILGLLKKNPKVLALWKSKKEYKILEALGNNSILAGPIVALAQLGKIPKAAADEAVKVATNKGRLDPVPFKDFIKSNTYLRGLRRAPTLNEVMYEAEKMISDLSKTTINFTPIFKDAIAGKVIYVKFSIKNDGPGVWQVITAKELANEKIYLRSKNGYTRASDRMGVQV